MRSRLWVGVAILVVAVAAAAIFYVSRRPAGLSDTTGSRPQSPEQREAAPPPPVPALALEVDAAEQLELRQGTPFVLTLRISNPRAANAAAANQANAQLLEYIQQRVARGEITAATAQPMIEAAGQSEQVDPIHAGTNERGWETFVHFERLESGGGARPVDWPFTLVRAPESKSITLEATSVAEVQYALAPQAAAQAPVGEHQIVAVFEVPAGLDLPAGSWRGRVTSGPVKIGRAHV